jgi:hypothetical protein
MTSNFACGQLKGTMLDIDIFLYQYSVDSLIEF